MITMIDPKTGEVVHNKESISDALLNYNEELLKRGDHSDNFKEVIVLKKKIVDLLMEEERRDDFNDITQAEYLKIVNKIMTKNKRMFEDIWSQDNIPEYI